MKKFCLITSALFFGAAVYAQDQTTHTPMRTPMEVKTRFGIKGGVNLANVNFKDDQDDLNTNNKTSFNGGLLVNIPIGGNLRVQPELVFSGQGTKYKATIGSASVSVEEDLNYINVPIMLQYQTPGGFFVETGPQAGILIAADQEIGNSSEGEDVKDDRKTLDFSWGAGLGYLSRIGLGINARYNYGFSNVLNAEDMPDNGKAKNRVIQIGLVYLFGAHK